MHRNGHLVITLRPGWERPHVPAHLDVLSGAARVASGIDISPVDRVVGRAGGGIWCLTFHARAALGRHGSHQHGFADDEHSLGFSRTYQVQLGFPERDQEIVDRLRALDCVESCEVQRLALSQDGPVRQRVSAGDVRAPYDRIHAAQALAIEPGSREISVAVVDTGTVVGHPEMQRRCLAGYDAVDIGIGRLNQDMELVSHSRGPDYNPYDEVGHGSLVSGIIGAAGWRIPPGLAGRALLLPIRVLAAARAIHGGRVVGVGTLPNIDAGLKIAVDLGANVLNMSFGSQVRGTDAHEPPPHQSVIRYAAAHGCILVAAAGNSSALESFYPAALPEVIAVGAVDAAGRRARFSTYGPHLALSAPGERIIGCGRRGYQVSSGTSFASPFVAGVAALMAARAARRGRRLDSVTAKRLLMQSAAPLPGQPRVEVGAGLLDAVAALAAVDAWAGGNPRTNGDTHG